MGSALDPLIATKLRPPRTPKNLVVRARLLERLERDPERRLTLLSAPAGFGKTTRRTHRGLGIAGRRRQRSRPVPVLPRRRDQDHGR